MDLTLPDGEQRPLRSPTSEYDLQHDLLARLPDVRQYEVLIVWVVEGQTLPRGISRFRGKKVLIIGDTHHQQRPLQIAMRYAEQERFDIVFVGNRQHAHWLRNAGVANLHWLPAIAAHPYVGPFIADRQREILLIGQTGHLHPRRAWIVQQLQARGYPISVRSCEPHELPENYGKALISLNVSLNADVNFRFYEVPAAGGFLLTDRTSPLAGVHTYFKAGEHYDDFGSLDELCAKIDHYLAHPEAAVAMAERGQARYLTMLDRASVVRRFWEAVDTGKDDPAFVLSAEPRFGRRKPTRYAALRRDVAIYEAIQSLHRTTESPNVLLMPDTSRRLALDCADLPNLNLWMLDDDARSGAEVADLRLDHHLRRISLAVAQRTKFDLVIGPDAGPFAALGIPSRRWIVIGPQAGTIWLPFEAHLDSIIMIAPETVELRASEQ